MGLLSSDCLNDYTRSQWRTGISYNVTMNSTQPSRFAVLIAAYNEEDLVFHTVTAAALLSGVRGVIVADDGSKDDTAKQATRAGAFVVSNSTNRGKGAALELAAHALEHLHPFGALDGVLLLDADLGSSAAEAKVLLAPLLTQEADLVIGIVPSPKKKAGFGFTQSLAKNGIAYFGKGFAARAPLSGQRAMTLSCLNKVRPFAQGYSMEVAMTIKALQQQQRIIEVPLAASHRYTGRNLKGFIHRGRQFYHIYRLLNSYKKQH